MEQRLLDETENNRDYVEYPEIEVLISNCCGCPCCCNVAYFPIQNLTFIGHWRKSLIIPVLVGFFYLITMVCYFFDTYNTFPSFTKLILSYIFAIFSFICFISGYYAIIIKGPGYVPYNWQKTHKTKYTWEESMSNIALYNNQVKYAQSTVDHPRRSYFSKEARRFVLRADHYCKLGKSWIGLKNYRYFLLTCFYCFLFSITIVLSRFWLYIGMYRFYLEKNNTNYVNFYRNNIFIDENSKNIKSQTEEMLLNRYQYLDIFNSGHKNNVNNFNDHIINNNNNNNFNNANSNKKIYEYNKKFKFHIWHIFGILTTLISFIFGILSLFIFLRNFYNLYHNVTTLELMTGNTMENWDHGCIKNFEEVCGSKKYLLCWPFPFICLEPMESGFYEGIWNPVNNNFDSESQNSKYQTMDSLY